MRSNIVKLSPYERAINKLNDLPLSLDKIFSEALEDLRKQRDEARRERDDYKVRLEMSNINSAHTDSRSLDMVSAESNKALVASERYKEALEQVIVDINNPNPRMNSLAGMREAMKATEKMILQVLAVGDVDS